MTGPDVRTYDELEGMQTACGCTGGYGNPGTKPSGFGHNPRIKM